MKVYSYAPKEVINEATLFYLEMIEQAFRELNFDFERIEKIKKAKGCIVITIRPRDMVLYKVIYPNNYYVNWYQGIGPEEFLLMKEQKWYKHIGSYLLEYFEKKALKNCSLNVFVSNAMKKHYLAKYRFEEKESIVVPCFNKKLDTKNILKRDKEYSNFSFVYAGTFYPWQCLDRTLQIYKEIENRYSNSSITLLTKEKSKAIRLLEKYNIKNYNIDFVPLELLDDKLQKFKYGFLIRDKSIINYVATPTKMNTYIALGLIPIYTNVVDSFDKNLKLNSYQVCLKNNIDVKEMANEIIKHHLETDLKNTEHAFILKQIFSEYYSKEKYIELIKYKVKSFL